jgi:hypothetical protein
MPFEGKPGFKSELSRLEDKCLANLHSTDPSDHKTRIKRIKGGLLRDAYRWILDHADSQQWRSDRESRLLWIKGEPGKGQTMHAVNRCYYGTESAPYAFPTFSRIFSAKEPTLGSTMQPLY